MLQSQVLKSLMFGATLSKLIVDLTPLENFGICYFYIGWCGGVMRCRYAALISYSVCFSLGSLSLTPVSLKPALLLTEE